MHYLGGLDKFKSIFVCGDCLSLLHLTVRRRLRDGKSIKLNSWLVYVSYFVANIY